jgi:hypothetical protein
MCLQRQKGLYRTILSIGFLISVIPISVAAQNNSAGVSQSRMEQGEAVVSVRSDISVAIKGTGGTTKQNVAALGDAVRAQIASLKACYVKVVAKTPFVVGSLQLVIDFSEKEKHPKFEFPGQQEIAPPLEACIRKTLGTMTLGTNNRPAVAVVTLDFSNTRAQGQEILETKRKQSEAQDIINVKTNDAGQLESDWAATDGNIAFVVTSQTSVSKEIVAGILRVLRENVGRFLDCRRRCSKGEISPAGEAKIELRLERSGESSMHIDSITISHQRAPNCIEGIFKKIKFDTAPSPVRVTVRVRFGAGP